MKLSTHASEEFFDVERSGSCKHCGSVVPIYRSDSFCCAGCASVFHLLHRAQLSGYYRIRDESGKLREAIPVHPLSERLEQKAPFAYLDDESFRTQLGIALHAPVLEFYLEGVHCTACMWLIEKLPELCPNDLVSARLDLQSSVVELQFQENGSISNVAEMIDELGYRPHPVFSNEHKTELLQHETRSFLTKVALAGACTGNIMIFAISIYAGATGFIKDHFDWIILALSLPVFSYCAIPLYKNAWHAIRNQRWSVDIPILIALGAGFVTSVYSVFTKGSQNYLDSLSGLVFLLLASRYWLMRLQKNAFEKMQISESFYPAKILRNNCEYVWVKELVQGDVIDVLPGMRIPVDGIVIEGESHLDESILNGESKPRKITLHESVYAGTHNYDSKLKIRVDSIGENSRIGKIAKEMQSFEVSKNETVQSAERVARWFTLSVLAWTSLVFAYFLMKHEPVEGIRRVLAILIVSCPCAFALATPLALIQAFQILLKCGLYLKDPNEIEKVRDLKQVALDKTGTLTEGVLEVFNVQWMGSHAEATQKLYLDLVRVLEGDSRHPVARAMVRFTERKISAQKSFLKIRDRNEIPGYGITALWNEHEV